jgi:hypothetical protein
VFKLFGIPPAVFTLVFLKRKEASLCLQLFYFAPVPHLIIKNIIVQGLFPMETTSRWDGQVPNPFLYWFCDIGDCISTYLVAMIQRHLAMVDGPSNKTVLQKFIELASDHSATVSLLEVWNYYGHWIPLHVNLNKHMPYLFHYCAFQHINIMPATGGKVKIPLPKNVYSNTLTVVRTLFYLADRSKLIISPKKLLMAITWVLPSWDYRKFNILVQSSVSKGICFPQART